MASGCICICSHTTGIDELIENDYNGYLVDDNSEININKIFFDTTNKNDLIGKNAQITINKSFNIDQTTENFINNWNKLI